MVEAGHEVWLACLLEPGQPDPDDTPMSDICRQVITAPVPTRSMGRRLRDLLLSGRADMASRLRSERFALALESLLAGQHFDLIHIVGLEMAVYLPQVAGEAPVIYDSLNAEYVLQRRVFATDVRDPRRWIGALYSLIQWRRLVKFERGICLAADHVLAVSEADAGLLRRLVGGIRVTVVPNGIYVDSYQISAESAGDGKTLVFTGKMDYRPNVDAALWMAEAILPKIQASEPNVRLFIVGQRPHPRLDRLRGRGDVVITGWVEDIRPYLYRATVYVAPLRMGSGTRFKVLEAMAAGRAVVSTTLGAEGIGATDGHHLVIADAEGDFADAVVNLMRDPERRRQIGLSAREFVRQRYDWSAIVPGLLDVYRHLGERSGIG